MSELGPLDHISRHPLPWRTEPDLTECGKRISELNGRVVTRAEIETRIRQLGQKRAAYTTCMTCAETSDRYHSEPVFGAITRELAACEHATPPPFPDWLKPEHRARSRDKWERKRRLDTELEAVAALVAAHRDEFDGYLAGRAETVNLADRRRTKRAR